MTNKYDSLDELQGLEGIRAVPGMYMDDLGSKGHQHLMTEAIDNSVDEALGGFATHIKITLGEDDCVTVEDDGRGIPVGLAPDGISYLVKAFGTHVGAKFAKDTDTRAYRRSGGLHGVGIAVIAAMSDRAEATVYRDGTQTTVQFQRGIYGKFEGGEVDSPFSAKDKTFLHQVKDTRSAAEKKERPTGTTIRYWVDHVMMDADLDDAGDLIRATIDREKLEETLDDKTRLVPGLKITLIDEREGDKYERVFHNPDGIVSIVRDLATAKLTNEPICFSDSSEYVTRGEDKVMEIDVVLAWENSPRTQRRLYTNIIRNRSGGTHENGFLKGLEKVIHEQVDKFNIRRAKDALPELEDIAEGLIYVVSAALDRPNFAGQTKDRLAEAPVSTGTRNIAYEHLTEWFTQRNNHAEAKAILEKIMSASRSRRARESKFSVKDAMASETTQAVFGLKPAKLYDCMETGAGSGSELFIVEGDSALGTLLKARSAEHQALFPLRGKPLNVYGESHSKLLIPPHIAAPKTSAEKKQNAERKKLIDAGHLLMRNRELDDLVKIIGAGFGSEFDLSQRRYDHICLAVDADVDGSHIAVLIMVFFFLYMRPLVTEGHIYITEPPLFVIEHGKRGERNVSYASSIAERDMIIEELKSKKIPITNIGRRKGLGESPVEEMEQTLMDPKTRSLKKVTVADVQEGMALLDMLFGKDTQKRKDWMGSEHVRDYLRTV